MIAVAAIAVSAAAAARTIAVDSRWADSVEIRGVGCGLPGSATIALPPSATQVQVRRPKVGATTNDSRLTEVAVIGASVRLTAVGAGEDLCDAAIEDTPPARRPWSGFYPGDFSFRERVTVPPPGVKCTYYTCPGHRMKAKIVAKWPSRCPDIGDTVYYGRISVYAAQRARFMKKGELYSYTTPGCQSAKPKRV